MAKLAVRKMTPYEILIAAKALIPDEEHWWRGAVDTPYSENCRCPITAIMVAAGAPDNNAEAEDKAHAHIMRAVGVRGFVKFYEWNDTPGRTLVEVQEAFDRAIAAALGKRKDGKI